MYYILPLEKERQLYHFQMSNDGRELKNNNIIPILNSDKKFENNGVIYVESRFQNDEYFELTNFNELSQEKWKEILKELASKIGAKSIKTTLKIDEENSNKNEKINNLEIDGEVKYKLLESEASFKSNNNLKQEKVETFKSSLEFELNLKGKALSIEEVEKWIKNKRINLENNYIYRTLFDNFKNDNLSTYKETLKIEKILSGITEINNTLEAIANLKSPLFSVKMNSNLNNTNKEEFQKYKKMELILEIIF